jgi:hypothetical protein
MTCQRSAGTVKVFEGLLLRVKVIVARKTKTPELPDRDTDTCRHQRLRLQPETSNKSPRNDLLAARSRWQNEAHEVVVIAPRAACKYEIVTCTNSAGISLRLIDRSRDVLASPLCFDRSVSHLLGIRLPSAVFQLLIDECPCFSLAIYEA